MTGVLSYSYKERDTVVINNSLTSNSAHNPDLRYLIIVTPILHDLHISFKKLLCY